MSSCSRRSALATLAAAPWLAAQVHAQGSPVGAELVRMLEATTANWNQGDLEGFIAPYAETTTFMTADGPIGRDAMRTRYATRYFTSSRPDQQLRFGKLQVRALGDDLALMTGQFALSGGGKPDLSGWFTLVWTRTPAGWRIIHDHSS